VDVAVQLSLGTIVSIVEGTSTSRLELYNPLLSDHRVAVLYSDFDMSSPLTPDVALTNLQATALTARCHNSFFRQKQLKSLHDSFRSNAASIKDAIKQDTRVSDAEATTEIALALDVVKEHYSSLEPKKELEAEYRITNGKDAADRRAPWGVVYVEPQRSHTPFFSMVVALSPALAAGNCVALKVKLCPKECNNVT
jgi:aldehyde dehydrogenase (NAD+)